MCIISYYCIALSLCVSPHPYPRTSGPDNSSDTESAPSPSQADPPKVSVMAAQRDEDSTGVAATASEQDASASSKGPEALPEVKQEKSPEEAGGSDGMAGAQDDRCRGGGGGYDEAQVHTKSEPQDVEMSGPGDIQVKLEPDARERIDKHGELGGGQHEHPHSDNDSSATCSADEDVETEPR